jgi:hypothetical protein
VDSVGPHHQVRASLAASEADPGVGPVEADRGDLGAGADHGTGPLQQHPVQVGAVDGDQRGAEPGRIAAGLGTRQPAPARGPDAEPGERRASSRMAGPLPRASRASTALGHRLRAAPTGSSRSACSSTSTPQPARRRAHAAASPPIPAPTTTACRRVMLAPYRAVGTSTERAPSERDQHTAWISTAGRAREMNSSR